MDATNLPTINSRIYLIRNHAVDARRMYRLIINARHALLHRICSSQHSRIANRIHQTKIRYQDILKNITKRNIIVLQHNGWQGKPDQDANKARKDKTIHRFHRKYTPQFIQGNFLHRSVIHLSI